MALRGGHQAIQRLGERPHVVAVADHPRETALGRPRLAVRLVKRRNALPRRNRTRRSDALDAERLLPERADRDVDLGTERRVVARGSPLPLQSRVAPTGDFPRGPPPWGSARGGAG